MDIVDDKVVSPNYRCSSSSLVIDMPHVWTLYTPEGMSLDKVIAKEVVPLPTNSEAIAMKLIAGADRLRSRMEKAVQDFDNAMKLFGKLSALQSELVEFGTANGSKFSWACFNPTY